MGLGQKSTANTRKKGATLKISGAIFLTFRAGILLPCKKVKRMYFVLKVKI